MTVRHCPAMPWDMFYNRQYTSREKALRDRAANSDNRSNIASVSSIANDVVCTGHRQIEHGRAGCIDAEQLKVPGYEACAKPRAVSGLLKIVPMSASEGVGRRVSRPMGRGETLNAPALLIDKDQQAVTITGRLASFGNKVTNLLRAFDIAGEKDNPRRACASEEVPFFARER
jgi:hypothetical protein